MKWNSIEEKAPVINDFMMFTDGADIYYGFNFYQPGDPDLYWIGRNITGLDNEATLIPDITHFMDVSDFHTDALKSLPELD